MFRNLPRSPPLRWFPRVRNVAGLAGVFLTLLAIGFGLVLFGKPNLEIISDTVTHTFGRSFAVGVLAQVLVIPTFGVLILGLILSVIGILLIPFAVIASALLVAVAVLAGFLGVTHALGEKYTRRRLAQGAFGSPNSYRYVATGLAGMILLWSWVGGLWLGAGAGLDRLCGGGNRYLVPADGGHRGGAAQPPRARRTFCRPVHPTGDPHRRVPLGHAAVRRPRGATPWPVQDPAVRSMTMRRALLAAMLLLGLAGAGAGPAGAQALKRFSTTRQFHGEVRLIASRRVCRRDAQCQRGRPDVVVRDATVPMMPRGFNRSANGTPAPIPSPSG